MTYEQYWYGDPFLVKAYLTADRIRQERENASAWWQGAYIYNALTAALSVSEFFRGKGQKPQRYPAQPYDIRPKTDVDKQVAEAKKAENERLRVIAYFDSLIAANKRRRGENNSPVSN